MFLMTTAGRTPSSKESNMQTGRLPARITYLIRHFKPLQQRHNLLFEVLLLQVKDIFT